MKLIRGVFSWRVTAHVPGPGESPIRRRHRPRAAGVGQVRWRPSCPAADPHDPGAATGKRVFRMAPLQHHFELAGWAETTIVVRFWIIAGICVALGLGILRRLTPHRALTDGRVRHTRHGDQGPAQGG